MSGEETSGGGTTPGPEQGPPYGAQPTWPRQGYPPPYGYPPQGYPPPYGYPPQGYPPYGYPPQGYAPRPSPIYPDPQLGIPLAHWWKRLVAWIIDGLVVDTVFFVFYLLAYLVLFLQVAGTATFPANGVNGSNGTNGPPAPSLPAGFWIAIVGVVLAALVAQLLYFAVGNGMFRGQTVGKLVMGIAVRDASTASLIGFWRGLGRISFNVLLDIPFGIPLLISFLSPLWDVRRQSWADHVTRSIVVDLKP